MIDLISFLAPRITDSDGSPSIIVPGPSHIQTTSDRLIFRRKDWAAAGTVDGTRDGQVEDAWLNPDGTITNTFSYPPNGAFVPSHGDGGDLIFIDGGVAKIVYTENGTSDGGTIAGWWVGGTGWILFDNDPPDDGNWRGTIATLAGTTNRAVHPNLNSAFTQWRLLNLTIPFFFEPELFNGGPDWVTLPCIVTEHYDAMNISLSQSMEREVIAQGVGRIIWQALRRGPPPTGTPNWLSPIIPNVTDATNGFEIWDWRYLTYYVKSDGSMTGADYNWPQTGVWL